MKHLRLFFGSCLRNSGDTIQDLYHLDLYCVAFCHWADQTLTDLQKWVCDFEKPKGNPTAFIEPATTVLSPYLKASNLGFLLKPMLVEYSS